jgi:hypothetical protein
MTTIFNWFARLKVFQKEEPKRIFRHKKNQKEYGKIHDKELQNLEHFSFTFLFCSSFSSSVFTDQVLWNVPIRKANPLDIRQDSLEAGRFGPSEGLHLYSIRTSHKR